jgi:hypothetical protein
MLVQIGSFWRMFVVHISDSASSILLQGQCYFSHTFGNILREERQTLGKAPATANFFSFLFYGAPFLSAPLFLLLREAQL